MSSPAHPASIGSSTASTSSYQPGSDNPASISGGVQGSPEEVAAAVKIQKVVRGHLSRRNSEKLRSGFTSAATSPSHSRTPSNGQSEQLGSNVTLYAVLGPDGNKIESAPATAATAASKAAPAAPAAPAAASTKAAAASTPAKKETSGSSSAASSVTGAARSAWSYVTSLPPTALVVAGIAVAGVAYAAMTVYKPRPTFSATIRRP